ncbi:MAG: protein-tyrosine-phosphatase [Betaproteobacteria bacterium HGW-Betaproteobacteria-7]|nr:MAG: protein-tyrosine-phosphatase [Betaproteobacteria bacterium HGW-Betaproteobacteria-7]
MAEIKNVLFLCTGNSARSIMAEAIINDISINKGKFRGFSAGSHPTGTVNPLAFEQLQNLHLPTAGLRSKSWEEFAGDDAPELDFVFTVCDNAAGEVCPVWPGQPMTAHWGIADPAAAEGTDFEKHLAFIEAIRQLRNRIELLTNLPLDRLDNLSLQKHLDLIGKS